MHHMIRIQNPSTQRTRQEVTSCNPIHFNIFNSSLIPHSNSISDWTLRPKKQNKTHYYQRISTLVLQKLCRSHCRKDDTNPHLRNIANTKH